MLLLDYPDGFVEMNAEDAARLGIRDGDRIRLCAQHGCASTVARMSGEIRGGTVFIPFFVREVENAIVGETPLEAGHQGKPVFVSITKA